MYRQKHTSLGAINEERVMRFCGAPTLGVLAIVTVSPLGISTTSPFIHVGAFVAIVPFPQCVIPDSGRCLAKYESQEKCVFLSSRCESCSNSCKEDEMFRFFLRNVGRGRGREGLGEEEEDLHHSSHIRLIRR
jgi:hypothetical protein